MSDEIKANYEELNKIAARFGNESQAINQMLQKVRGGMDPLENGGWQGRGSDSFFSEMNSEVIPATQRLQKALAEASRVTKEIVNTMKDAEEEASSPFRSA